jgi:hypothetical protein
MVNIKSVKRLGKIRGNLRFPRPFTAALFGHLPTRIVLSNLKHRSEDD